MSLQTGKPWMIERNSFFESIEVWCKDPTATDSDNLLGAFVTLRLLTSEVFRLLTPRQTDAGQNTYALLTIISNRIDEWESKWLTVCSGNFTHRQQLLLYLIPTDPESCHGFLVQFYGTHLRLQLYSLPLQEVLGSAQHDVTYSMGALWSSYSSAINMLKLVAQYSRFLYFVQDSIHVMTAYAAVFLIKVSFRSCCVSNYLLIYLIAFIIRALVYCPRDRRDHHGDNADSSSGLFAAVCASRLKLLPTGSIPLQDYV